MDKLNNDILEKRKIDFKVKEKKLISEYKDGYLGKKVYDVLLNDGTSRRVEQLTKKGDNGDAVVILPITLDGNFVMVVESRPNTFEEVEIAFPAGMVDKGEDPIISAKRELLEETGYKSDNIFEMEWHYQDQGCSKAIIHTFLALDCEKVSNDISVGGERLDSIVIDYNDLKSFIDDNIINGANSKIAYYEYINKYKKSSK